MHTELGELETAARLSFGDFAPDAAPVPPAHRTVLPTPLAAGALAFAALLALYLWS